MRPLKRRQRGLSLVEAMVAVAVVLLVLAGVGGFFAHYRASSHQQEEIVAAQNSLRAAAERVGSHLRRARYGVPRSVLPAWVDWVPNFTANPRVVAGATANDPDRLVVAACTSKPVATVSQALPAGLANVDVVLESAVPGKTVSDLLDPAAGRGLIRFSAGPLPNTGFAKVVAVGAGSTAAVRIDTDPGTSGDQGFASRSYAVGTPICRVDVVTYAVDTAAKGLTIDEHNGAGPQLAFDGITNLKVSADASAYTVTLGGQAETNPPLLRAVRTTVSLRNP